MALYGTITSNTTTDVVHAIGPFLFKAYGTWGSGTFVVQYKNGAGTWVDLVSETALTSDATGQVVYAFPETKNSRFSLDGVYIRGSLSGATGASLSWEFVGQVIA